MAMVRLRAIAISMQRVPEAAARPRRAGAPHARKGTERSAPKHAPGRNFMEEKTAD